MNQYDADLALFINGGWKIGEGRDLFPVVNPASGDTIAEVPLATPADLDAALAAAGASTGDYETSCTTDSKIFTDEWLNTAWVE